MNFDELARSWDGEERRIARAKIVAERLLPILESRRLSRALDFGCGTGLLSFLLRDFFSSIDLLDPSRGMIEVLRGKIADDDERRRAARLPPGAGMRPELGDLDSAAGRLGPFDVIFSMLVLHHIRDTQAALRGLRSMLAAGGALVLIDLDKEDGSYHSEPEESKVHKGFDRGELADLARRSGFSKPVFDTVYVERRLRGEGIREYPLFVLTADAME